MNFALILFLLLILTGFVVLLDRQFLAPRRFREHEAALAGGQGGFTGAEESLATLEERRKLEGRKKKTEGPPEPWWVEYSKSFFPVILIVFLLRSFVVEPFRIPSGSMLPTLFVGDFILVNKFSYGIRLPVVNKKILDVGSPHRGDVLVFRYPKDPSVDFIKRLIGLPGDKISYMNKRLYVNGELVPTESHGEFVNRERYQVTKEYLERLGDRPHLILLEDDAPPMPTFLEQFPYRDNCQYVAQGVTCTVPPGHYFMMGDNRDNSQDSRVWGFVPDENVVGRAFFIWFNFSDLKRIGSFD
jgi:signal peptidase I